MKTKFTSHIILFFIFTLPISTLALDENLIEKICISYNGLPEPVLMDKSSFLKNYNDCITKSKKFHKCSPDGVIKLFDKNIKLIDSIPFSRDCGVIENVYENKGEYFLFTQGMYAYINQLIPGKWFDKYKFMVIDHPLKKKVYDKEKIRSAWKIFLNKNTNAKTIFRKNGNLRSYVATEELFKFLDGVDSVTNESDTSIKTDFKLQVYIPGALNQKDTNYLTITLSKNYSKAICYENNVEGIFIARYYLSKKYSRYLQTVFSSNNFRFLPNTKK